MRMTTYFRVFAYLLVPALGAAAWTGFMGAESHLTTGLVCSILAVGTHSLLILFMIVTGRVLREAVRVRDLPQDFLDELNTFFADRRAYPAAGLASTLIVTAAVLGYGNYSFGLPPAIHMLTGLGALFYNLYALTLESSALMENQRLLDRAAFELDASDARGESPIAEPSPGTISPMPWGPTLALGAWLPYLYWGLVTWRGDFSAVSIHPWIEFSSFGVLLILLSIRGRRS
jgi:hypothetical protein